MTNKVTRAMAAAGIAATLGAATAMLAPAASATVSKASCDASAAKVVVSGKKLCFTGTGRIGGIDYSQVTSVEAGSWVVIYSAASDSGRLSPHDNRRLSGVTHLELACL